MALVRPLDVDCRYSFIYFNADNLIEISGLAAFTIEQFLALVKAYPDDFPKDIVYRLIKEQSLMIDSLEKQLKHK